MKKRVIVYLAEGFEETEAVFPIDVMKRAGLDVVSASCSDGLEVTSAHGMTIRADVMARAVTGDDFDAVFLPGGMPGSMNLYKNRYVTERCLDMDRKKGIVAAICAAPAVVLAQLGILEGHRATCYPGCDRYCSKHDFLDDGHVVDGNIITARSAAFACDLGLDVVRALLGDAAAADVETELCIL